MDYRVHIISCGPRTGTTLLAEAMNSCFRIDCASEHEDRIFKQNNSPGTVHLTKYPGDVPVIRPFLYLLNNLYLIYMLRDPRDMVVSKHGSDPGRYWCSLRYWTTFNKYYKKIESHPRVIAVKYEEFVNDPDRVQKKLMKRMPFLEYKHAFSNYHAVSCPSHASSEALLGVRPISGGSVGKWKLNLPRIAGQIRLHGDITPSLIEHGYEKDASWLDSLQGVASDTNPSHYPEYFSKDDIKQCEKGRYRYAIKVYLSKKGFGLHRIAQWF